MNEAGAEKKPLKKVIQAIIILLFVFFILVVCGFLFYLKWALKTPLNSDNKKVLFEVEKGETSFQISQRLFSGALIRSDWIYYLNAKFKNITFIPGVYDISSSMTMEQIASQIGSGETKIVKITIPEGYRREQIGQKLAENNLASLTTFLGKTKGMEGKLFPDTYYFSPDNTLDEIIEAMKKDFADRTSGLNLSNEDLIIASIVEREAAKDEERPIIAGVYKNRIKLRMKLEADPTVQYGKDSINFSVGTSDAQKEFKFWTPITKIDYQNVVSDYNTYKISALPPAPICNPGTKSIEAAQNFTVHDYLYFFQHDGEIYLSKTSAEHVQKANQYLK